MSSLARGFVSGIAEIARGPVGARDGAVATLQLAGGAQAHLLAGLAEANCLVVVPDEVDHVRPGDVVDVLFLARQS